MKISTGIIARLHHIGQGASPVDLELLQTKIARASCRRCVGTVVVPRVEIFGDLITADHKILIEESESRNNHRYAVVVQDLAMQWRKSYPCKTKTSQETEQSLRKFLEPTRKPEVIHTDNSLELANPVKIFLGIIVRQHRMDRKLMGLLREWCAELRKGHLLCCCNQVWMKIGGQIPWNAIRICETFKISRLMRRLHTKGVLENLLMDHHSVWFIG